MYGILTFTSFTLVDMYGKCREIYHTYMDPMGIYHPLPKTNIAPEIMKLGLLQQKEMNHLPTTIFQGKHVSFREGIFMNM